MKYNEVEMEILRFDVEDIITTSPTTSGDIEEGDGGED